MPSPAGWGENKKLSNARIRFLKPSFLKADKITFINEVMCNYQKKCYPEVASKIECIYNPMIGNFIKKNQNNNMFTITYLGSLGGKRVATPVLEAFNKISEQLSKIKLVFVGTNPLEIQKETIFSSIENKVEFIPWTNDPTPWIENSDVLIDIDADIKDDVFVSSKLMRYLNTDIPIVSITSRQSPTHQLINRFNDPNNKLQVYMNFHQADDLVQVLNVLFEEKPKKKTPKTDRNMQVLDLNHISRQLID
jgi:glycosyltransferase involved in cell wall biosynthesis